MTREEVKAIAVDKLGAWRHVMRAELKAIPDLLAPSERILTMASASFKWRGRLLVVTDRGLVFISKAPLRPVRCERYPHGEVASLQAVEKPIGTGIFRLEFTHEDEQLSWGVQPFTRALDVADIAGLATAQGGLLSESHRGLGSDARAESETADGRLTHTEVKEIAVDQLRIWRRWKSSELVKLPAILAAGEQVMAMACSTVVPKDSLGPLIVATDRRLLLLDEPPGGPLRCDDLPYLGITLIDAGAGRKDFDLSFSSGDNTFSFHILPPDRGPDLAYVLGAELEPDRVSVDPPKNWMKGLFFVLQVAVGFGICLLLDLFLPREVVLILLVLWTAWTVLRNRRRRRSTHGVVP